MCAQGVDKELKGSLSILCTLSPRVHIVFLFLINQSLLLKECVTPGNGLGLDGAAIYWTCLAPKITCYWFREQFHVGTIFFPCLWLCCKLVNFHTQPWCPACLNCVLVIGSNSWEFGCRSTEPPSANGELPDWGGNVHEKYTITMTKYWQRHKQGDVTKTAAKVN